MEQAAPTAASLYDKFSQYRTNYLERARVCATLTIPSLMPPSGFSSSSSLYTPYQSVGARGLNNLSSKLLMALFPMNTPFFRLMVDDYTLSEEFDEDGRADFEEALGDVERTVMTEVTTSGFRTPAFMAFKQLICCGNVLLLMLKGERPRIIKLDSYVVKRSPDGQVLELIVREEIAYEALPEDIRQTLESDPTGKKYDSSEPVPVYTRFYLDGSKFEGYQEVEGVVVPGSKSSWPKDKPPFLALRWTAMDGEDYGRGHVEEYIGDLNALEGLSQSILESSLAAAKTVIMVRPNSTTKVQSLVGARNLDVIQGQEDDVHILQLDKRADLQVAMNQAAEITQRLSQAFLLSSSVQRDAERVTAEEIRYMAAELEDSLGGTYSLMAQEFQLPFAVRFLDRMTREKRIPALPQGIVPAIVTGLEALGRGHDLTKYQILSNEIAKYGEETVDEYLNLGDYFKRFGTGLGIDMDGLIRSEEEREARRQQREQQAQQQMMAELAGKAIGPAIQAESKQFQGSA